MTIDSIFQSGCKMVAESSDAATLFAGGLAANALEPARLLDQVLSHAALRQCLTEPGMDFDIGALEKFDPLARASGHGVDRLTSKALKIIITKRLVS